ncbi:hypothetical protein [Pseudomonas caricapapayae]|uniref:hypothetical protein n=1 Tax=Pseudomonas caricapapayae TaxID=46678 RepID=UPI000F007E9E|nr:hypothetical protein [Pseudomonas caricapapayae]
MAAKQGNETLLEIAGFDINSLVRDVDDVELAVGELALHEQFKEHFWKAFDLLNMASSFFLEDGSYTEDTDVLTATIFRCRDDIYAHTNDVEGGSLPTMIRSFVRHIDNVTDSKLVASYALVLATQAVEVLANWLFNLELAVYDTDPDINVIEALRNDLPDKYLALLDDERGLHSREEIDAREEFATLLGQANQMLFMANLHLQIEQLDLSENSFNVSSRVGGMLDNSLKAVASKRAHEAGLGNRDPESKIQTDAQHRRSMIEVAARKIINGRMIEKRSLSDAELTKLLFKQGGHGTEKTIRVHLTALGLRPLK